MGHIATFLSLNLQCVSGYSGELQRGTNVPPPGLEIKK